MSRILTPYKQLQDIIIRALALIAFKFYRQAAWWLLSIKYYDKQKKERQEVYEQILRQIKEHEINEGNSQPLIYLKHVESFYKKLIQVSDLRPEQQRQDRQTLTKIMDKQYLQKVEQQNIILPINDYVMPYINPKINFDSDYDPYKQNYGYITSIDPYYTIISSLQQPKKITLKYKIKGGDNNEEKKHFLLKNEKDSDVRTESRTTEFISVLNQFLQTSNFCNRRNINMQNYCIIPLCKEMSLIEWVDNTKTLKDIFDKEGSKKKGFQTSAILNQKNSKLGNIGRQYNEYQWKMLTHQEEVISNYFYTHFDTVDYQLSAIERYTKTLAICTAFVYIIGLGDRHASNILLCEETGDVFNIDFQCIFEKGKKLAVPELLPFRLTKNVEGPLGAFKSYGLFRLYLINILEFFKKKEKNIMGALDSFLSDPIYTGKQHENSVLHYTQFLTQARNRLTFKQFSTVQQGVDLLIEYAKNDNQDKIKQQNKEEDQNENVINLGEVQNNKEQKEDSKFFIYSQLYDKEKQQNLDENILKQENKSKNDIHKESQFENQEIFQNSDKKENEDIKTQKNEEIGQENIQYDNKFENQQDQQNSINKQKQQQNSKNSDNNSNSNSNSLYYLIGGFGALLLGVGYFYNSQNEEQGKKQVDESQKGPKQQIKPQIQDIEKKYKDPKEQDPDYFGDMGVELMENNKFEEAVKNFDQAIKLNPKQFLFFYFKAKCLQILGKPKEAMKQIDESLKLSPQDPSSMFLKAQILDNDFNDSNKAIKLYEQALKLDEKNQDIIMGIAVALGKQGKSKQALEQFDKAIAINPDDPIAHFEKAYYLTMIRKQREAIEEFNKVLEKDPDNADALLHKGNNLGQLGYLREALKYINRAIEINPKQGEAYYTLGLINGQLGDKVNCIKNFEKVIRYNPKNYSQICVNAIEQFDFIDDAIQSNPDFWERFF
ncbi:Protein kinase-like domain [Pseudocohnilembus persalinus]|uniref:Protein kinase-like domain n=1 Tax=Pseudocohnilembus persalinus TaxID=266149 RepID=A0A0V0QEW7_PSEPJ|nr:Protein kinase-like domain [Pseudocohnilembus persalinus]|eukprot:KRX00754.1 Protein kinase-like domain [Pseudocohnilembus persalinus]